MKHFELTVTVNPNKQRFNDVLYPMKYGKMTASEQWNLLKDLIKYVLPDDSQFLLIPELHKNDNIHVHGHIMLPPDFYDCFNIVDIRKKLNQIGRSSFGEIISLSSWLKYLNKDQSKMDNRHYKTGFYQLQLDLYMAAQATQGPQHTECNEA